MNFSGILISFKSTPDMRSALEHIQAIDGVEIFQVDEPSARAIAVIEAETTGAEVSVFEKIQKVTGVMDVSLVNHYFGDEPQPGDRSANA